MSGSHQINLIFVRVCSFGGCWGGESSCTLSLRLSLSSTDCLAPPTCSQFEEKLLPTLTRSRRCRSGFSAASSVLLLNVDPGNTPHLSLVRGRSLPPPPPLPQPPPARLPFALAGNDRVASSLLKPSLLVVSSLLYLFTCSFVEGLNAHASSNAESPGGAEQENSSSSVGDGSDGWMMGDGWGSPSHLCSKTHIERIKCLFSRLMGKMHPVERRNVTYSTKLHKASSYSCDP